MIEMNLLTKDEYLSVFEKNPQPVNVMIFKYSPVCSISRSAEREVEVWMNEEGAAESILLKVDVINQRDVSRFIAKDLGIEHESPQFIWLDRRKEIKWVGNHYEINRTNLSRIK